MVGEGHQQVGVFKAFPDRLIKTKSEKTPFFTPKANFLYIFPAIKEIISVTYTFSSVTLQLHKTEEKQNSYQDHKEEWT